MPYYPPNIQNPMFQPAVRDIAAITNAEIAQVTTSNNHLYVTGMVVRLLVNTANGMPELNDRLFRITVNGATTFTIPEDTTGLNSFVIPTGLSPHVVTLAQVVPVGEQESSEGAVVRNTYGV